MKAWLTRTFKSKRDSKLPSLYLNNSVELLRHENKDSRLRPFGNDASPRRSQVGFDRERNLHPLLGYGIPPIDHKLKVHHETRDIEFDS